MFLFREKWKEIYLVIINGKWLAKDRGEEEQGMWKERRKGNKKRQKEERKREKKGRKREKKGENGKERKDEKRNKKKRGIRKN